ncbi:MAG: type II toxin-antitoxin system RelE/ParE family toxin [Candidatus Woykebacteria bacterium]
MEVIITPKASKQYDKIPNTEKLKVEKKLLVLSQNPYDGKKLSGNFLGLRSLRAWPYRIIYYLDEKLQKVFVVTIAHRQGVYE